MGIESTLFSMAGVGEAYNIFGFIFFFLFILLLDKWGYTRNSLVSCLLLKIFRNTWSSSLGFLFFFLRWAVFMEMKWTQMSAGMCTHTQRHTNATAHTHLYSPPLPSPLPTKKWLIFLRHS